MSEFLDNDPYVIQIKSLRAELAVAQKRVGQLEDDVHRRSQLYNELFEECAAERKAREAVEFDCAAERDRANSADAFIAYVVDARNRFERKLLAERKAREDAERIANQHWLEHKLFICGDIGDPPESCLCCGRIGEVACKRMDFPKAYVCKECKTAQERAEAAEARCATIQRETVEKCAKLIEDSPAVKIVNAYGCNTKQGVAAAIRALLPADKEG